MTKALVNPVTPFSAPARCSGSTGVTLSDAVDPGRPLPRGRDTRIVSLMLPVTVRREAGGRGLFGGRRSGMGMAVYSFWAGDQMARRAGDGYSWAFFALCLGIAWLWCWVGWHAIRAMGRAEQDDPGLPLISPGSWGEPDLAPPSQSPQALAEVAELEAIWRRSSRRRPTGPG